MAIKRPKLIFQLLLGVILLSFVTACNNDAEKKETADSAAVKPDTIPMAPVDTTKMDTASTREPVKPSD